MCVFGAPQIITSRNQAFTLKAPCSAVNECNGDISPASSRQHKPKFFRVGRYQMD